MHPDQFAAYLCLQGLADQTIKAYRALWVRWCDFATTGLHDPTPAPLTVRLWVSTSLPGSRAMLAQARATISHACTALGVDDCSTAIVLPRRPRTVRVGALDPDAAARLEQTAHTAGVAGTAVLVGLYTAARRAEIAAMEWARIGGGWVTFWRPKTRDWHRVPVHPVLGRHLEQRRGGQWLFPGRYGGHVSPATIGRWVEQVAAAAGLPSVTCHRLRHTALTWANHATTDLAAVQLLAGHTDPATTATYLNVDTARIERAVAALNYQTGPTDAHRNGIRPTLAATPAPTVAASESTGPPHTDNPNRHAPAAGRSTAAGTQAAAVHEPEHQTSSPVYPSEPSSSSHQP